MQPWIEVTARYAKFAPFPVSELIYVPGKAEGRFPAATVVKGRPWLFTFWW
jgi:hypothetical protein